MNTEEATAFVIQELSRHHNRNDLLVKVCQELSIEWDEAEKFVKSVESQNSRAIVRRQSPFMIALAIGILLVGIGMVVYSGAFFLSFFQMSVTEKALLIRSSYYRGAALLTGLGMIIGGFIGLWNTLSGLMGAES